MSSGRGSSLGRGRGAHRGRKFEWSANFQSTSKRRKSLDRQRKNPEAPEGKNDTGKPDRMRPPPHLKGREIGMFYAKLSKQRKAEEEIKPLGSVFLSDAKKQQIQLFLSKHIPDNYQITSKTYDHVESSNFKTNFLEVVQGNLHTTLKIESALKPNENLDETFLKEFQAKQENPNYLKMKQQRNKLPAYKMQQEIVNLINNNQVVIISGETGCGKTTQVSQFILDDHLQNGKGSMCKIVCSQPRRISAISVAERVAEERAEKLGHSIGFQIRLENVLPRNRGSITFCTTGVILKKMESNLGLAEVSHLILDEIHERDVQSDFLISLLKSVVAKRKDLKVILMSATLNAEAFAEYFGVSSIIEIPGFTFDVTEYYLEDVLERTGFCFEDERNQFAKKKYREFSDIITPYVRKLEKEKKYSRKVCTELLKVGSENLNLDLILELLINICQKEKDKGAILVFLTGFNEISGLDTLMKKSKLFPAHKYLIIPLHSQMPTIEQKYIFKPAPTGVRKIILSTNIAETSITIDDVVFVIDCGKIKMTNYNVEENQQILLPEWVSQANANQRRGRAGRVKPGICFHLFTKARFNALEPYQKPEILRKRLEDVILMVKILQLGKADKFLQSLMDPPDLQSLEIAVELLQRLNALDDDENLTPLGYHLAKLPLGPQMGKMILLGAIFSCLDPILSIAASLDFKDAFLMPLGSEYKVDQKKLELANGIKSDHMIYYEALKIYEQTYNPKQFCWEYYLSQHTMKLLMNMKQQFMEYLYEMNFVPNVDPKCSECNKNSNNMSLIKAIICAGLYPNIIINRFRISKGRPINNFYTVDQNKVKIHPKSILKSAERFESPLIVYYKRMKSTADFIHDGTMVHPLSLLFFGDRFSERKSGGDYMISVNEKLRFKCSESTGRIIGELRERLNWFLETKISHPGFVNWDKDDEPEIITLRAIMELITIEDEGEEYFDNFDEFIDDI